MRWRAASRGYALLSAMAFLTILGVVSYAFQSGMEVNATVVSLALRSEQARALAAGGVAEARAALSQGASVLPLATPHPVGAGEVSVRVENLAGKLHLNQSPVDELAALLRVDAAAIARARPFVSVEDTFAALRLGPDQYAIARAHTTVHGDGRLDLDVAPAEVLSVVAGLSPSQAEAIVRHRIGPDGRAGTGDDRPVNSVQAVRAVPGIDAHVAGRLGPRLATSAAWYRVVAQGRVQQRTARVETVLHRGPGGWAPVTWVDWAAAP